MKWYIGIDPGQKGGIALIDGKGNAIEYMPMPATVTGIIDAVAQYERIARLDNGPRSMICELAQPMPKQGSVSGFTYGRHFGAFEVICSMLDMPYHEVRPAAWKKALGLNSEKLNSILLCERIFPNVGLIMPRCHKPHDGIAEALLIAEWGRRANL